MNKLISSACILFMGTMLISSCSNDDSDSKPKQQPEIENNHQAECYEHLGKSITIASGVDGKQAQDFALNMESVGKYIALNQPFANAVKNEWRSWGMTWMQAITRPAAEGTPGILPKDGNAKKPVAVTANGVEIAQLFKKGAIGMYTFAGVLNQINKIGTKDSYNLSIYQNVVAYYLGDYSYLSKPRTTATLEGKEVSIYPYVEGCEFGKYVNVVNNMPAGIGLGDQFIALLKQAGTQLKDNKQFKATLLQAQAVAQKIIMVRCCHYLKEGSNHYTEGGLNKAFHNISEGLGFFYAMPCSLQPQKAAPYFTYEEMEQTLNDINLWQQEKAQRKLEQLKEKLERLFGIDDTIV